MGKVAILAVPQEVLVIATHAHTASESGELCTSSGAIRPVQFLAAQRHALVAKEFPESYHVTCRLWHLPPNGISHQTIRSGGGCAAFVAEDF